MTAKVLYLSELSSAGDWQDFTGSVVCFGHFNAIHPGHIRYFLKARQYGSPLVVALEGDALLAEIERTNSFEEYERAQAVAALDMIDYVVILDTSALENFVGKVSLAALVLGREFEQSRAEKVYLAVTQVLEKGAEVFYDAGETHYASAEFFHASPRELENERWHAFQAAQKAHSVSLSETFLTLSKTDSPRILVVGDSIIDQYVACEPVGMSNEAPVIVVKELESQEYVGGAAIVAAHVAALGAHCIFLSVTGNDSPVEFLKTSLKDYGVDTRLLEDSSRPTTYKIRYLVENQKLFRVSRLKEDRIPARVEDQLIKNITDMASSLDGILVSDFVYGVITPRVVETLLAVSRDHDLPLFGDLQCSSQVGNISRFQHFHLISPTEREARIALSNQDDGIEFVANLLMEKTHSANLILKLGAGGFIAYNGEGTGEFLQRQHFPALTANPIDVAGAGDALLAAVSVGLVKGLSLMEASAIACCVSAIAVQTVGNRPVSLNQVHQYLYQRNGLTDEI